MEHWIQRCPYIRTWNRTNDFIVSTQFIKLNSIKWTLTIEFNQFKFYANVNLNENSPVLCLSILKLETIQRLAPPFTRRDTEDGSLLVTSAITDTNGRFRLTGSHQRPDAMTFEMKSCWSQNPWCCALKTNITTTRPHWAHTQTETIYTLNVSYYIPLAND